MLKKSEVSHLICFLFLLLLQLRQLSVWRILGRRTYHQLRPTYYRSFLCLFEMIYLFVLPLDFRVPSGMTPFHPSQRALIFLSGGLWQGRWLVWTQPRRRPLGIAQMSLPIPSLLCLRRIALALMRQAQVWFLFFFQSAGISYPGLSNHRCINAAAVSQPMLRMAPGMRDRARFSMMTCLGGVSKGA